MENCRCCDYIRKAHRVPSHWITLSFVCLNCRKATTGLTHDDRGFWGTAIECFECHNYISYLTPENFIWKDEIYLKDWCLIRNLNDQQTFLLDENDKVIASVQEIIHVDDLLLLEKRVKMMAVFS